MIDINKRYRYRNGEEARILCVDRPTIANGWPVISLDSRGNTRFHLRDGRYDDKMATSFDLIEVKEKKVVWLNVYKYGSCSHPTKEDADGIEGKSFRLARIKVTYEEGQFDE